MLIFTPSLINYWTFPGEVLVEFPEVVETVVPPVPPEARGSQSGHSESAEPWHYEEEILFSYGSTGLKLPKRLIDRLDAFLGGDPCSRWDSGSEDGEDIFRLILETTFFGMDQNVTQEDMAQHVFQVKCYYSASEIYQCIHFQFLHAFYSQFSSFTCH